MDPGMAFGTGHHATTSLSLDLLRQIIANNDKKDLSVLDVGCGTGILGMGAALFGATKVLGIDNDPEAVRVATGNVALNKCDSVMDVSITALTELTQPFDCIVANIIHDVLITMIGDFKRLIVPNGSLVLSGILQGYQERNIIEQFEKSVFSLIKNRKQGEWVALYFENNNE
jgi:ribosomal protein L11 methyltransferase